MENSCGFCDEPKNTRHGLGAKLNLVFGNASAKTPISPGIHYCPLGFTHNPTTIEATQNLIKNGGRHSICQHNPWKWL